MATSNNVLRQVKPILSSTPDSAKRRVLGLYKRWLRNVPEIVSIYQLPKSEKEVIAKIKAEFMKHQNLKDLRVIDRLVIRGQMDLMEISQSWQIKSILMARFDPPAKSKTFLSKFLSGHDP